MQPWRLARLALAPLLGVSLSLGCHLIAGLDQTKDDTTSSTGASCDEVPCRLVPPQCGCHSDQQCNFDSSSAGRECIPKGSTPSGSPCNDQTCEPGSACSGSTEGLAQLCRQYCSSHDQCSGGECVHKDATDPDVRLCSQRCDLTTSEPCPPVETLCYIGGADGEQLYTECFQAGAGLQGDPCTTATECAPTFFCSVDHCVRWCKMGSTCPNGPCDFTLKYTGKPVILEGTQYGACP